MDGVDLEQLPHLAAVGETLERSLDLGGAVGIGARQRLRAGLDAEADQPFALRHERGHPRASAARSNCERFEVDVGRQVLLARVGEQPRETMAA